MWHGSKKAQHLAESAHGAGPALSATCPRRLGSLGIPSSPAWTAPAQVKNLWSTAKRWGPARGTRIVAPWHLRASELATAVHVKPWIDVETSHRGVPWAAHNHLASGHFHGLHLDIDEYLFYLVSIDTLLDKLRVCWHKSESWGTTGRLFSRFQWQ